MKISFPQNLFKSPNKENIYFGKKICRDSKILFCGIARNVEKTIEKNIEKIKFLGRYFKKYEVFIYENDSIDNTKILLNLSNIQYLSEKRNDESYRQKILNGEDKNHFNRCKILASCRNKYIDYAKKHCSDFDFICVLDWDIYGWSYKGFYDSIFRLQSNNKLASVSAYGVLSDFNNNEYLEKNIDKLLMYDSFAFRPLGFNLPLYPQIQYLFNHYKTDKPTIVRSNFGGMSIYKNKLLLEQQYEAREINGMVDCDHVVINDKISNLGFNHLLNNYFIVSYSRHRFV
jgi:hypothetical protein